MTQSYLQASFLLAFLGKRNAQLLIAVSFQPLYHPTYDIFHFFAAWFFFSFIAECFWYLRNAISIESSSISIIDNNRYKKATLILASRTY